MTALCDDPLPHKFPAANGGFGEVCRAEWDNMEYAVKMFPLKNQDNWEREAHVYKTCYLAHPNILKYFFMDKFESGEREGEKGRDLEGTGFGWLGVWGLCMSDLLVQGFSIWCVCLA